MGIIGVLWTTWGIWLQSTFIKESPFARWPVFFKIGFHYCQLKIKKHLSNEHLCFPAWALHHKCPFRHYDSAHTAADCGVCYSWGRMGTKIGLSCSHWWVVCVNRQEHGKRCAFSPSPTKTFWISDSGIHAHDIPWHSKSTAAFSSYFMIAWQKFTGHSKDQKHVPANRSDTRHLDRCHEATFPTWTHLDRTRMNCDVREKEGTAILRAFRYGIRISSCWWIPVSWRGTSTSKSDPMFMEKDKWWRLCKVFVCFPLSLLLSHN